MKLYKCDRCGCTIDSIVRSKLDLTGDETREADLCTSCRVDFVRWLNGDPEGISSAHALGVIRKLEDEVRTVENIPDYGRRDRTEFKFGYRNGCQKAIELLRDETLTETAIESAEQMLAPPGTFEWVLARVRLGASWEAFRRSAWPNEAAYLGIMQAKMMILSANRCIVGFVDGYDVLATDWEEIPKEESE